MHINFLQASRIQAAIECLPATCADDHRDRYSAGQGEIEMICTVSETGMPSYSGATSETAFDPGLFHPVTMLYNESGDTQFALHTDIGSFTVLDRMTGFGFRDVESGFRDTDGRFWLASGGYDVRTSNAKTIGEAIEWVKSHANTCVGYLREKSK